MDGIAGLEGEGWVNWSALATLLGDLGEAVAAPLDCLLHITRQL